jgi:predicted metalloprotease with PDZ domain
MTLVRPGSSADKLGISSGDRLVSIGDVDVAEFFGERPSESDSTRFKKLMGVGLKAIDGDLHVLVMKKAGNLVDVPLPK